MEEARYRAGDLLDFGRRVLEKLGFPARQAQAACQVLLEGDLRGDPAHGLAGNIGLMDFLEKMGDQELLGFRRLEAAEYSIDPPRYPTAISLDAHGCLGHYAALEILPELVTRAREYGYAKVYIRNSTHFGDCGVYSEMIAEQDLAAKVTCTAPAWSKPFVEMQNPDPDSPANRARYQGVKKRLGTNPMAWSIPHDGGVITMDMAATQRAVSPALAVARHNQGVAGVFTENGEPMIMVRGQKCRLAEVHLEVAKSATREEAIAKLGLPPEADLLAAEKGLMMGPNDEEIIFPLAIDSFVKKDCHVAPLGGSIFGYKGFGLNLLVEMDNVLGGGAPGLIRQLGPNGLSTSKERVSQTLEAYALDAVYPLAQAKQRLAHAVTTTLACSNRLCFLPGQKEREHKALALAQGVPLSREGLANLARVAAHPLVDIPFDLAPVA